MKASHDHDEVILFLALDFSNSQAEYVSLVRYILQDYNLNSIQFLYYNKRTYIGCTCITFWYDSSIDPTHGNINTNVNKYEHINVEMNINGECL